MANQITVNSGTGNITVTTSRSVIGTVANVESANYANFAGEAFNLNAASTANVVIGGGTNGYVLQTDGAGNLSWTEQTGGGGNGTPGGSNSQVQYNDNGSFGGDGNFTFNDVTGIVSATGFAGDGGNIANIQAGNVSGKVANAVYADNAGNASLATIANTAIQAYSVDGANVVGEVAFAATANSVALGNVSGAGNIASINIDGNSANYLDGTGSWGPVSVILSGDGGNISNIQGANVSGAVANATHAVNADSANSVAVANVVGIGNIATTNYDGNASNVLHGDGTWSADITDYSNANVVSLLAAFGSNTITTTGLITGDGGGLSNIAGANVVGAVANATYADTAGSAGTVTPAGANTQVQFNDGGVLGADANFAYNKSTPALSVGFSGTGQLLSSQVAVNKTLTSNTYLLSTVATLNNASDMTLWKANITDTLSGANTKLIDMIVDSNSMMTLDKAGQLQSKSLVTSDGSNVFTIIPESSSYQGLSMVQFSNSNANYNTFNFGTSTASILKDYDTGNAGVGFGILKEHTYYVEDNLGNSAFGADESLFGVDIFDTASNNASLPTSYNLRVMNFAGDLATPGSQTTTNFGLGNPGIFLSVGSNVDVINPGAFAVYSQTQYSDVAIRFNRRGGNADARSNVSANTNIASIEWNPAGVGQYGNGSPRPGVYINSNIATFGAVVDSTYTGAQFEPVPMGMQLGVVNSNDNAILHQFYANGDVSFSTGVISGDGGGLSNVQVGNTVAQSYAEFVTGTANVAYTANTPASVAWNSTVYNDGFTLGAGNTQVTINRTGYYKVTITIALENLDNNRHHMDFWWRVNGTDVTNSSHVFSVGPTTGSGDPLGTRSFSDIIYVTAGDYGELMTAAETNLVQLSYRPAWTTGGGDPYDRPAQVPATITIDYLGA